MVYKEVEGVIFQVDHVNADDYTTWYDGTKDWSDNTKGWRWNAEAQTMRFTNTADLDQFAVIGGNSSTYPKITVEINGTCTFTSLKKCAFKDLLVFIDNTTPKFSGDLKGLRACNVSLENTTFLVTGYNGYVLNGLGTSTPLRLSVDTASAFTAEQAGANTRIKFYTDSLSFQYDNTKMVETTSEDGKTFRIIPKEMLSSKINSLTKVNEAYDPITPGDGKRFTVKPIVSGIGECENTVLFSVTGNYSANTIMSSVTKGTDGNYSAQLTVGSDETALSVKVRAYLSSDAKTFVEWSQPVNVPLSASAISLSLTLPTAGSVPTFPKKDGYVIWTIWLEMGTDPGSYKLAYEEGTASVWAELFEMTEENFKALYPPIEQFTEGKNYELMIVVQRKDGKPIDENTPLVINGEKVVADSTSDGTTLTTQYGPITAGPAVVTEPDEMPRTPYPDAASVSPETLKVGDKVCAGGNVYSVLSDTEVAFAEPAVESGSVVIPETILIGGKTFTVTEIAGNAFKGRAITAVQLSNKLTTIGERAFYGCKNLRKIVIPRSVKKIGKQAFYKCSKLRSITIKTTKLTSKSVGKQAFGKLHAKASAKVPKKKLKAYKSLLKKKGMSGKKQKIR